jgi:hypothetical protein
MMGQQQRQGMSEEQGAKQLVDAAEAICVHLYGPGHSRHHTRRVIISALIAADEGELAGFIQELRKT